MKLLHPSTTATMFLPISCTSPLTVAMTTVPAKRLYNSRERERKRERKGGRGREREREILASIKELHVANVFIFIFNGYSSFLGCFLLLFLHERDEVTNSFLHDTSRLDHLTSHMMYYDRTLELTCGRNIFPEPNRSPTMLIPWRGGGGGERKGGKVEVRRERERERER